MSTLERGLRTDAGGFIVSGDTDTGGFILSGDMLSTFSSSEIVEEHDGYWTVRDVETGIFGSGSDLDAALEDFQAALREHHDVLSGQPALSEDLEAQLQYLTHRLS